jgi:hypothetical protein
MKKIRFTDEARWPVAYIPSSATDITKTFARIRKQLAEQAEQEKAVVAEAQVKVRRMK